jgi:hypothetical protein
LKLSRSISVGTQEVTLLAALLRTKVSKVSAVWIGAGMELNEKVPMLGAFNHVITLVDVGGEPVWLDVTAEVAPYRALLKMLRDKQALVVLSTGDPELRRTPAELPFSSVMRYEANSSWIALSSTPSRALALRARCWRCQLNGRVITP